MSNCGITIASSGQKLPNFAIFAEVYRSTPDSGYIAQYTRRDQLPAVDRHSGRKVHAAKADQLCPATGGKPSEGCFVDLSPESLGDVTDPALRVMLERLAEESRVGNYGIYFGNQNSGQVRRVSEGAAK